MIRVKQKILDILTSADDYISGEKMSQRLGISRAAVWKHIKSLKNEGYGIESVTNKGYRVVHVPDIISEHGIKSGLKTEFIGQNVRCVRETDSTNNEAARFSSMSDGTVFTAEIQTGGKGRLGKEWVSQKKSGIWMSVLLKPYIAPPNAPEITLIAGLAVCRALKTFGARIKWPNDIVIDGKKICGILTEMSAEIERVNYIVCGIGINVNTENFPKEISDKAASLYTVTGEKHNRCVIIRRVLEEFETLYKEYLQNGFAPLRESYKALCVNIGRHADAVYRDKTVSGEAVDITDTGELVIKTTGGNVIVSSGEVSVSGIYGHI